MSQTKCQLSRDGCSIEAVLQVLQVQKGAPVDLLLGTDVLPRLRFALTQTEKEGHPTDLLQLTLSPRTQLESVGARNGATTQDTKIATSDAGGEPAHHPSSPDAPVTTASDPVVLTLSMLRSV